ncbi:unnamed protein product, partial [Polarella glacialis]
SIGMAVDMGAVGEPAPSTPPVRRHSPAAIVRLKSTEKLAELPQRSSGSRGDAQPEGLRLRTGAFRAEVMVDSVAPGEQLVVSAAVDCILSSPSAGDEKYWAQIRYAYRMLSDSIGSELALSEAVNRGQTVLEPIFRDAILAQEVDRVNAVTMLAVLRELVTRADGETQTSRHAVDDPTVALAPKRPRQDEFWEQTGEEGRASEHEVNE